ncbi:MAG TPA: DUF1579 domain-containing protein [Flavobacteriales bacterium]|nr:DUF1579 domain-containing protein [Flavobacteriales bacterium]
MKKKLLICSALMLALIACGGEKKEETTEEAPKEEAKTEEPAVEEEEEAAPPDSAAMMKAWMDYATPGEMHKLMASWAGKFDADVTMWMDPAAPPTKNKATSEAKMWNGLYLVSTNKGSMNGMPFEGVSTIAYDNSKKKFVNTWIDNMGSGIMILEGDYDPATKTLTLVGSQTDPMTGKDCEIKETTKFNEDGSQYMEMYMIDKKGKETKTMEMMARKK